VEANSTGGQGSRTAVAPGGGDDDDYYSGLVQHRVPFPDLFTS
jgi:hypothetical protein